MIGLGGGSVGDGGKKLVPASAKASLPEPILQ